METDIENRIMDTEREGEGGMNGESGMETYTTIYKNRQPMGICCLTQGLKPGAQTL